MGSIYSGENMNQIEKWQHQIKLLEREQRYIQEDIEDLLEKIKNESEADRMAEEEYVELISEN
jgi:predicted transcriptional regulator